MSRKLDQNMENETMIKARTTNENNAQNYSEKENQILTKKVSEWAVSIHWVLMRKQQAGVFEFKWLRKIRNPCWLWSELESSGSWVGGQQWHHDVLPKKKKAINILSSVYTFVCFICLCKCTILNPNKRKCKISKIKPIEVALPSTMLGKWERPFYFHYEWLADVAECKYACA